MIVAGLIGIPLLYSRTRSANRSARAALEQAKVAAERHDEQTKADRERRIIESFAKAVEQLGSDKLEARLGAIYTLERISKEKQSEHDYYWPIMETLTAYVRERAPWPPRGERVPWPPQTLAKGDSLEEPKGASEQTKTMRPATDIQAVLTVLGRRDEDARERDQAVGRRLDLIDTDLRGAHLEGAHLEGAKLSGAHLQGATIGGAYLEGANLYRADLRGVVLPTNLQGVNLSEARLEGTNLGGANLKVANLSGAHLQGADFRILTDLRGAKLSGAHLQGANLGGAYLEGANLWEANLQGAQLDVAHLEGTDLRRAVGLTQEQLRLAYGDDRTLLPDGLTRPVHWPAMSPDAPDNAK